MSLDQNLFTLNFAPNKDDPNVVELVDPSDNPHYRKERVLGNTYLMNVYDPLSHSLLASATAPSATSKHKTIELHNPSQVVELKFSGTLTFKWKFKWEDHEFEWKREECFILRKPDPAVLVAVTKEPSGRIRTSTVQILDYNLNRFDIDDRKGLEIVILTALLTFQDTNDAYHTAAPESSTPTATVSRAVPGLFGTSRRTSDAAPDGEALVSTAPPPPLPPKPAPRTGVDRVAEVHTIRAAQGEGMVNEVLVDEEGTVEDYAEYAERLLKDDAMLFATIRSASAAQVPKVLQVVEHTRRLRHKAGLDEDQELHQYVVYDTDKPKGPKRINLNDPASSSLTAYVPPSSLSVHLSKIDMPELQPRAERRQPSSSRKASSSSVNEKGSPPGDSPKDRASTPEKKSKSAWSEWREERERDKERERERRREIEREKEREKERRREAEREKEREKERKKAEKDAKKKGKDKDGKRSDEPVAAPPPSRPPVNRLSRPHSTIGPPSPRPPQQQHAPPMPMFPEPQSSPTTYYGGSGYPPNVPPPAHPGSRPPRPTSYYGPSTFYNSSPVAPGWNTGFLRP